MPELKKAVVECYVQKGTSKKGNDYEVLVLEFENGYKMRVFLSDEQKYILSGLVPLVL